MSGLSRRSFLAGVGAVTVLGIGNREIESDGVEWFEGGLNLPKEPKKPLRADDIEVSRTALRKSVRGDTVTYKGTIYVANTGSRKYFVDIAAYLVNYDGRQISNSNENSWIVKMGVDSTGKAEFRWQVEDDISSEVSHIVVDWIRVKPQRLSSRGYTNTRVFSNEN